MERQSVTSQEEVFRIFLAQTTRNVRKIDSMSFSELQVQEHTLAAIQVNHRARWLADFRILAVKGSSPAMTVY